MPTFNATYYARRRDGANGGVYDYSGKWERSAENEIEWNAIVTQLGADSTRSLDGKIKDMPAEDDEAVTDFVKITIERAIEAS